MATTPYDVGLERNPANFQPLTPLSFLDRAARVHPDRVAVIHGTLRRSYAETMARCRRLASALARRGIGRGATVSVLLPNTPTMIEAHHGVPMAGAVLNAINTRLEARTVAFILDHCEARAFLVDREFAALARAALDLAQTRPLVIGYDDPEFVVSGEPFGDLGYEDFLAEGDSGFAWWRPEDEWDAISLNYTSGTTGEPKGVVYHHRGAYLLALGNIVTCGMAGRVVYLWSLPMFHCNGWCFPWSIPALAGTQVCLRRVQAKAIYDAIAEHGVTHLCGAPIVMATLLNASPEEKRAIGCEVSFFTAAAPPPESVLAAMKEAGFAVTHLYGLTETYGPAVVNDWHEEWNEYPPAEQAALMARQGVCYVPLEDLAVLDPLSMQPVPADGATLGEVMFRGNVVAKGYFKNPGATERAFASGWFHSGDLAVMHPDGYLQLRDRAKDIIISGGENISSIEIEETLYKHPAVQMAAVVAMPDEKWGEVPCAFIELRPGSRATAAELCAWCRERLAHFKCPRRVVFAEIPKTLTGKIQKFALRERARALGPEAAIASRISPS